MTMETEEPKLCNCPCGEPHMNIDVFKENGTWIALCHECDRLEYSANKYRAISKWNENIEKERNSINPHITLKSEIYEGLSRWVHNVCVRWHKEYGVPMNDEELEEIISLFVLQIEDKNNNL